ncbi:MAG TPA: ComEC/Rec2 family competence protein [Candidatus Ozemobacteraceae bacterium]|nr:ComEC/Rec2 family competence protein [Candidatus Ozemobacteraceae bacterium]HQG27406.1 ComEC/Rec2 family competence protein [Candidatus Ozemobacteraceae bacterium]
MQHRSSRFFTLLILVSFVFLFQASSLFSASSASLASGLHTGNAQLRVTFLDVGQGDAILIRTREKTILIDAGNDVDHAAEDIILPFLEAAGIEKIDTAVITHAHRDHFGGFLTLVEALPIGEFIYSTESTVVSPGDPEATKGDDVLYKRLFRAIREKNIPLKKARMSDSFNWGSQVHVDLLHADHPHPAPAPGQPALTANDTSLVFKVTTGKIGYLFTGDATALVEREMIAEHPACFPLTVLKVGHHGSKTSSTNAFLNAARPDYAVFSVGISNSYNHPSPEVLERYASRDVKILRTDHDGTVDSRTDGSVVTFSSTQNGMGLRNILAMLDKAEMPYGISVAASRHEAVNALVLNSMKQFVAQGRFDDLADIFGGAASPAVDQAKASLETFLKFRRLHGEASGAERDLSAF